MPDLEIRVGGFIGAFAKLNRTRTVGVSKNRLRKFAITVGLPVHAVAAPSARHAMMFAAYKAQAIKCAVDFSKPTLGHHKEYTHLDPSEKANLSYWTGMTLAALTAEEVLGVPRLIHAAAFGRARLVNANVNSRSLADLIGADAVGHWHVVEAKARQSLPSDAVRDRWKGQATTIATVDGTTPATASYAFTWVDPTYRVELIDPPGGSASGVELTLQPNAVLRGYYGPLLETLGDVRPRDAAGLDVVAAVVAFDAVDREDVLVGMTASALERVRAGELPPPTQAREFENGYVGSDGIVVLGVARG
jgi:hypothetical protein